MNFKRTKHLINELKGEVEYKENLYKYFLHMKNQTRMKELLEEIQETDKIIEVLKTIKN